VEKATVQGMSPSLVKAPAPLAAVLAS
jgi:hypothetical protein